MHTTQIDALKHQLVTQGDVVNTETWQGVKSPMPMYELLNVHLKLDMCANVEQAQTFLGPKLPWADNHFNERIQGFASNPDPSYKEWHTKAGDYKSDGEIFSHTYSERIWPKDLYKGIRFEVGDLATLIELLYREPDTRKAFLPMFMHEDLSAALDKERVPCTIGWHFIIRNNTIHCTYTMRSCDAIRHLNNDLYLANRLAIYINERLGKRYELGTLTFNVTSLHCFTTDKYILGINE